MACGCKDKAYLTPNSTALRMTYPQPDEDGGIITLQGYEDCTDPYTGAWKQATVFVVGYGTDNETLFRRADRTAAIKMARDENLTLDQLPASSLCHQAMVDLLGS
jgi:hypothetical protein